MSTSAMRNAAIVSKYGYQAVTQRVIDMVVDHMMNVLPLRPRYPQQKTPDLAAFVTTVVQRSQATLVMVIVALIYVDRMKRGLPARSVGDFDTPHRLFFVGLMLASKFLNDQSFTNRAWSKVSNQLFRTEEVNTMERDFLELIGFNLFVDSKAFGKFVEIRVWKYDHRLSQELAQLHGPFFTSNQPTALYSTA